MTSLSSFVFLLVTLLCLALPAFAQNYVTSLTGMNGPTFVALDTRGGATWLYVSEHGEMDGTGGGRILRYNLTTGSTTPQVVATAGTSNGQFRSPDAILVDGPTGDIFVADRFLNRVQRLSVNASTGAGTFIMKWGQDVAGAADEMSGPLGLARDGAGAIYITEHGDAVTGQTGGRVVSKYTIAGNVATRVWRTTHGLNTPYGIVVYGNNLYVADGWNSRIQVWDLNGEYQSLITTAFDTIPVGLSLDSENNLWVVQTSGRGAGNVQMVEKRTLAGLPTGVSVGTKGTQTSQFDLPFHAVRNVATNRLYVTDYKNDRVQIFDLATDTSAPTVVAFTAGPVVGNTVNLTITFSEPVTGFDSTDLTVNATGGATATIGAITTSGTMAYVVPVTFGGITGKFSLGVKATGTSIRDAASNNFAGGGVNISSEVAVTATGGDGTPPTVASFTLQAQTAATVTYALSFSEVVTGVTANDFTAFKTGGGTASVASATGSGANYVVVVNYTGTGTVSLLLNNTGTGIADVAGNAITTGAAAPVYTVGSPIASAVRVSNLSSRLRLASGDSSRSVIAGFVVAGGPTNTLLIRAVGPSLTAQGITNPVAAPTLKLYSGQNVIAQNTGWNNSAEIRDAGQRLGAFDLLPNSTDSALLVNLAPGVYTAQVEASGSGTVLVEVYDAASGAQLATQQLMNLSTRGFVETGDNVIIAGFVVDGTTSQRVLVRGIGPGLARHDVSGVLANPMLEIYRAGNSTPIATNDDWDPSLTTVMASVGAEALDPGSRDAAVVLTLAPGVYTAILSGSGGTTGAGLVEVYKVANP